MEINTQNLPTTGFVSETVEPPPTEIRRAAPVHQGVRTGTEDPPHEERPFSLQEQHAPPDIEVLAQELNDSFESLKNTSVRFRVDRELGELLISVVDQRTDEVVRQIPSEEMVELTRRMQEFQGLIFDRTA